MIKGRRGSLKRCYLKLVIPALVVILTGLVVYERAQASGQNPAISLSSNVGDASEITVESGQAIELYMLTENFEGVEIEAGPTYAPSKAFTATKPTYDCKVKVTVKYKDESGAPVTATLHSNMIIIKVILKTTPTPATGATPTPIKSTPKPTAPPKPTAKPTAKPTPLPLDCSLCEYNVSAVCDMLGDCDGDGFLNSYECWAGTNPCDDYDFPGCDFLCKNDISKVCDMLGDCDDDGYNNSVECDMGFDPCDRDDNLDGYCYGLLVEVQNANSAYRNKHEKYCDEKGLFAELDTCLEEILTAIEVGSSPPPCFQWYSNELYRQTKESLEKLETELTELLRKLTESISNYEEICPEPLNLDQPEPC